MRQKSDQTDQSGTSDAGPDGMSFRERSRVSTAAAMATALRDLINKAGDGELVSGRMETAIAEQPDNLGTSFRDGWVSVTLGTKRFLIQIRES